MEESVHIGYLRRYKGLLFHGLAKVTLTIPAFEDSTQHCFRHACVRHMSISDRHSRGEGEHINTTGGEGGGIADSVE